MGTSTRKIEVYCTPEESSRVRDFLRRQGLYWYSEKVYLRDEEEICRLTVYAPFHALQDIYRGIASRIDLRKKENHIVVLDAEAAVGTPHRVTGRRYSRLVIRPRLRPLFMLRQEAEEMSVLTPISLVLAVIASLVALAGLVLNNPYIILGAMLLSPILAPIYAFSASVVIGYKKGVLRSLYTLSLLLFFATTSSLFAAGIYVLTGHTLTVTHEIETRAEVTLLGSLIPVLLGIAAMLGPSSGAEESLVGVAIAAAIIPPSAALGWALAAGPELAGGILANLLVNVAGLLAGGVATGLVLRPKA